jgi:hypothetical protein
MTEPAVSVRSIFFNSPADAVAALTTAVGSGEAGEQIRGALGRMGDAGQSAVFGEVASVAAGLLELDVTEIFGAALGRHSALRREAAASLAAPHTERIAELATHSVSYDHHPSIEIHVANLPVATIGLLARLEFRVRGLLAVVRGGRLIAIRAGNCDLTGTLAIAGVRVAQREVRLDLPLALRLGDGVALLDEPAATPA